MGVEGPRRSGVDALSGLAMTCTLACAFLLGGCLLGPPGEDARGRVAKSYWHPVPIALSLYREDHGAFPVTLSELVPDYIAAVPAERNEYYDFSFYVSEEGSVIFSYGPVACSARADTSELVWQCAAGL